MKKYFESRNKITVIRSIVLLIGDDFINSLFRFAEIFFENFTNILPIFEMFEKGVEN